MTLDFIRSRRGMSGKRGAVEVTDEMLDQVTAPWGWKWLVQQDGKFYPFSLTFDEWWNCRMSERLYGRTPLHVTNGLECSPVSFGTGKRGGHLNGFV
jgi:hypothetical protein